MALVTRSTSHPTGDTRPFASVAMGSKNPYSFGADTSSATGEGSAKLPEKQGEVVTEPPWVCSTISKCTTGCAVTDLQGDSLHSSLATTPRSTHRALRSPAPFGQSRSVW